MFTILATLKNVLFHLEVHVAGSEMSGRGQEPRHIILFQSHNT